MFHTKTFWYKPYNSDSSKTEKGSFDNSLKNKAKTVVLHSFAHLSNSKSDPETANEMIQNISEKLKKNLSVHIVPFGQFYEFSIHVLGPSL